MRFNLAFISGYAVGAVVGAALLVGACSSDGKGGVDAGGGDAAAGASGQGGASAGGSGGSPGAAGTSAGGRGGTVGAAGTGGAAGTAGVAGRGGAGGTAGGIGGGAGGIGGVMGIGGTNVAGCVPGNCAATAYCDLNNNSCLPGPGICKSRPLDCINPIPGKVCGCNGIVYNSECEANGSGQDISAAGGCTAPAGLFACGPYFCTHGSQYCEAMIGGAITNPGSYACHDLPTACGATPSCACLSGTAQCGNCLASANGDLTTRCLFP
jgi:hypothetical protein